ncbi:MAG: hypothetical protein OEQ18_00695 [Gammaproteobacteria bacterium]|nr:hypothetical protein [Gammaproteobacteria bacterium]
MAADIVTRLVATVDGFIGPFRQAERQVKGFADSSTRNLQNFQTSVSNVGRVLVSVFVTGAIAQAINKVANLGDELAKMNQRTGLSVEFLNGLTQTAQLADVSMEQLTIGLFQLNKNLLDTVRGTGEAKTTFAAMGIGATEAAALLKTPEQAFLTIADRLAAIPDPSIRAAEAMRIFGKSGAQLLPLLNQGKEAIAAQIAEMHKLRPITAEMAKASEAYNDSITTLTLAFEGFLIRGVGPLLPSLTRLVELMTELVSLDTEALGFRLKTLGQDLFASLGLVTELLADPLNYKQTLEKYEALDKQFMAERKKRFARPEASTPGALSTPLDATIAPKESATIATSIALKKAALELLAVEEKRDQVSTDRQFMLKAELLTLEETLSVQKEIEAAEKAKRGVDQTALDAIGLSTRAKQVALAEEEKARIADINSEKQVGLGLDIQSSATQALLLRTADFRAKLAREEFALQLRQVDTQGDARLLDAQRVRVLEARFNLSKAELEVNGRTTDAIQKSALAEAELLTLKQKINAENEAAKGRSIVQNATTDIQRQLEPFRKAVREAQLDVDLGAALPGQLKETQLLRQIELQKQVVALAQEERRVGLVTGEDATRQFILEDAKLRALQTDTQGSFIDGWRRAFANFANDAEGAFGLGQTLARNFVTNMQSFLSQGISTALDAITDKTITWRDVLQTLPNILKQITAQLLSMAIVQGVASAIGGGLSGSVGSGISGAQARGAANPALFGPGFASGGSFVVGGRGGVDANLVPLRLTRGERVTVETEAQQRRSGGGGLTVNVMNNYAAGADVRVQERQAPNGSVLEVMIERKVKQVNKREFGLSPKPGRVG